MNQYKKSRLIVVSSILVVLSFSLLYLTATNNISFFSNTVNSSLSVIHSVISKPVQIITVKIDQFKDLVSVYEENKELKNTISSLEDSLSENDSLKRENESLKQSLGIVSEFPEKNLIQAMVSVRVPVKWDEQIMIDKGKKQGISEDMLVMANGGLAGIVEDVSENSSKVRLLSNSKLDTKIAVRLVVENQEIYGILTSYLVDENVFVISQLNTTMEIPQGTKVVTSDLSSGKAANLSVGTVQSSETNVSDLRREVFIKPSTDFSSIYAVTVVGE